MFAPTPMASRTDNRSYYDAFARGYDDGRDVGYHKLIDDQAAAIVGRYAAGKEALEVGCGTGLILERVAAGARRVKGIDLSPGMLAQAKGRGLDVEVADATELPFADDSFDVAYSFKVLAHIPQWQRCVAEMVRVVRPGGHVIFDVYNRNSLRFLIKRLWGPRKTSESYDEGAISTNFMTPAEAKARLPAGTRLVDEVGIRIAIPHPAVCRLPVVGGLVSRFEWATMDSRLARVAGFYVLVLEKQG
ncbi:MAG: class I SAM-dependent methyltransferase [Myxococcales bacterium]|nr:class I SAM-dependent methyltransferase [Myxococcales bacterium]